MITPSITVLKEWDVKHSSSCSMCGRCFEYGPNHFLKMPDVWSFCTTNCFIRYQKRWVDQLLKDNNDKMGQWDKTIWNGTRKLARNNPKRDKKMGQHSLLGESVPLSLFDFLPEKPKKNLSHFLVPFSIIKEDDKNEN